MATIVFVICIVALLLFLMMTIGEKSETHKIIDLVFAVFLFGTMILLSR